MWGSKWQAITQEPSRLDQPIFGSPSDKADKEEGLSLDSESLFTLNVGGLSAFMWADLRAFLNGPGSVYDAILLQETHRTDTSEFQTQGWRAIGTATKTKADGFMTLIHPKHPSTGIKHEALVQGRALRTQIHTSKGRIEVINVYQHVWSHQTTKEQNIAQRQKLLDKISRTIQHIARRDTLIVAGDFNAELVRSQGHTGTAHANTARQVGAEAPDPQALTRFAEDTYLVALNTFHCKPPHGQQGKSQIDFVMTRSSSADARAKHPQIFEPQIAGWKELGHRAIDADIRIIQHYHLPTFTKQSLEYDRHQLDQSFRAQDAKYTQHKQAVQDKLQAAQDGSHPDTVNECLLQSAIDKRLSHEAAGKTTGTGRIPQAEDHTAPALQTPTVHYVWIPQSLENLEALSTSGPDSTCHLSQAEARLHYHAAAGSHSMS